MNDTTTDRPLTPESEARIETWARHLTPDYLDFLRETLVIVERAAIARDREGLVEVVARALQDGYPEGMAHEAWGEARRLLALDAPEADYGPCFWCHVPEGTTHDPDCRWLAVRG